MYKNPIDKLTYSRNYTKTHVNEFRAYRNNWNAKNRDKVKAYKLKRKLEVILHYSPNGSCSCGFNNIKALTIDHVNGKGTEHRKSIGKDLYTWLRDNNYPEGFQVLCMNCQWIKRIDNKECRNRYTKNQNENSQNIVIPMVQT